MTNRFQTKEGGNAEPAWSRSFYNLIRGERWVLHQASEDPRGRIWHKLDRNGKVVDVKKGALNFGGNTAEWVKGGMGNLMGDKGKYKDWKKSNLKVDTSSTKDNLNELNVSQIQPISGTKNDKSNLNVQSNKNTKSNKKGFWEQLSESFDDPGDMEPTGNKAVDNFFGYGVNKKNLRISGLSEGAKEAQAMARARIEAGKSTLGDFGSGDDRGKLAAQHAFKNKKKLKFTKEQKKWLKENPSGTFINDDGIDQAYSPEFDLIRFNQAKKHKQWLIDHGRV